MKTIKRALTLVGILVLLKIPLTFGQNAPSLFRQRLGQAHQQPPPLPPQFGTFYSLRYLDSHPPLPFDPFPDLPFMALGDGSFLFDDLSVNYEELQFQPPVLGVRASRTPRITTSSSPAPPGTNSGSGGIAGPLGMSRAYNYTNGEFWIEITGMSNNLAYLSLHNMNSSLNYCQIVSKTNLNDVDWMPETVEYKSYASESTATVPQADRGNLFLLGAVSDHVVSIVAATNGTWGTPLNNITNEPGSFFVHRSSTESPSAVTAYYHVFGTATNGVDYATLSGSVTIPAGAYGTNITVQPISTNLRLFSETVTVRLVLTNGYVLDPTAYNASIYIDGNITNFATLVATNLRYAVGIDYHTLSNCLLYSVWGPSLIHIDRKDTNGFVTNWSNLGASIGAEVKLATVKTSTNGFLEGETFFGNGQNGGIGRLSPDGTNITNSWVTLTNETVLRGSLYFDQTGVFGNDLIAVTGGGGTEGGGVWRINSARTATRLVNITNTHLEGVITLTNDQSWGPWAGKIITGAESENPPLIYAIDTNGVRTSYALGIAPEDFDIIQTNQNLYCLDPDSMENMWKLSSTFFNDYVGQLLITQGGETGDHSARLFIVRWDGTKFVTRTIRYKRSSYPAHFEHVTFAPINVPDL